MSKILRALVISAVATGVAAMVLNTLKAPDPPPRSLKKGNPIVDADALPEAQRDALLDELASQI